MKLTHLAYAFIVLELCCDSFRPCPPYPRQAENAISGPAVAQDVIRREVIEFEVANGMLSRVRIQFDHVSVVVNPEDTEFELFQYLFNSNEDYESVAHIYQ